MDVLEVPMTDKADATSVENRAIASICAFDVNGQHFPNMVVAMKQIEYPEAPPHDFKLLQVSSLRALFRLYGIDLSSGLPFLTFHPVWSGNDETRLSTGSLTVNNYVLFKSANFLSLDEHYCLEAMQKRHRERDL